VFHASPIPAGGRTHVPSRLGGGAALILSALVAVSACGSSGGQSAGSTTAQTPAVSQPPATQAPAASTPAPAASTGSSDTFTLSAPADIKSAGKIEICADIVYPPYTFMQDNKPTGIDVDAADTLAKAMGVSVEWVQTGFVGIVGALQGGKCNAIINGINDTAEHRKVIAQVPYLQDNQGFVVKKGNPQNIQTLDDLSGKSVATQLGSSTATTLEGLNKKLQAAGKAPMKIVTLPQDTAAFSALLTGRVDAYFQDSPVLGYYASKYPEVQVLPLIGAHQTVVVGIRKNDTQLIDAVTQGIKKMYELGLMQQIAKKWNDPPANLLANMPGPTS
jgi:polar amino acid transport system substrate-binding protein